MNYEEMTSQTKEVLIGLLNEKLNFWKKYNLVVEQKETGIEIRMPETMNGNVATEVSKICEMFSMSFYVTCEYKAIMIVIY